MIRVVKRAGFVFAFDIDRAAGYSLKASGYWCSTKKPDKRRVHTAFFSFKITDMWRKESANKRLMPFTVVCKRMYVY